MHPAELQLIQLSRQIIGVAQQAAMAYEQAQAALRLDQLFTLDSVETVDGTRRALDRRRARDVHHRQRQPRPDQLCQRPDGHARQRRGDRYDAAQQVIDDIHEYEVAQMKKKLAQATIAKTYLDEVERGGRP
jgi:hypothetical protein